MNFRARTFMQREILLVSVSRFLVCVVCVCSFSVNSQFCFDVLLTQIHKVFRTLSDEKFPIDHELYDSKVQANDLVVGVSKVFVRTAARRVVEYLHSLALARWARKIQTYWRGFVARRLAKYAKVRCGANDIYPRHDMSLWFARI